MTDLSLTLPRFLPVRRTRRRTRTGGIWRVTPWLYLLPAAATFLLWIYWPLVDAVRLSFFQWNLLPASPLVYVGTENYETIVTLPKMWQALRNTGLYLIGLLPLAIVVPLAIAIYTHDLPARWRNIYRAIIFVPMIIPPVVAAAVWRWLLDPGHGVVNVAIKALGGRAIDFLGNPAIAIWTIIGITGWKLIGFSTLILSAANANINPSLIEAARMDGASKWEVVRDIRLPLLSPTIVFLVIMTMLLGAQWTFTYINVLTNGGPLGATTNIYHLLWDFGFSNLSVGWSSAAAVILFFSFGVIAFLLFRLGERLTFHDN